MPLKKKTVVKAPPKQVKAKSKSVSKASNKTTVIVNVGNKKGKARTTPALPRAQAMPQIIQVGNAGGFAPQANDALLRDIQYQMNKLKSQTATPVAPMIASNPPPLPVVEEVEGSLDGSLFKAPKPDYVKKAIERYEKMKQDATLVMDNLAFALRGEAERGRTPVKTESVRKVSPPPERMPVAEEAPKKRGRPPGSKSKPKMDVAPAASIAPVDIPESSAMGAGKTPAAPKKQKGTKSRLGLPE